MNKNIIFCFYNENIEKYPADKGQAITFQSNKTARGKKNIDKI
jgi:hypothetical protein